MGPPAVLDAANPGQGRSLEAGAPNGHHERVQILTVNAGSSSLRLALCAGDRARPRCLRSVHLEGAAVDDPEAVMAFLDGARPDAVAHRIVHGGRFGAACLIDAEVEREIGRCAALAPLHNPPALHRLRALRAVFEPSLPQVAVFDTAFFHDLPAVAARYPLPASLDEDPPIRRYGFHGNAHRAMLCAWQALRPDLAGGGRVISLQLGAGCSIAAVAGGRAVDTSMGFTPLEGLMMATRSGDIDAGLLIHLQRARGLDTDALERLLTRECGLAGVSGTDGDMRALLASDDPRAALAIDMFCYRVRKYIGAFLAVLGGADAILFGGGIGEHSPEIRRRSLRGLEGFGIMLDDAHNAAAVGGDARIAVDGAAVDIHAIAVDEARELALAAIAVLDSRQ